mmetsp:Transcript_18619/g.28536  ORF Transcript_18619/g.28536 Transcript_18619/m.28536 type:complete len:93 (-) Transcript_18619:41-319(-)
MRGCRFLLAPFILPCIYYQVSVSVYFCSTTEYLFHSFLKGGAPMVNESVTNSPTKVACNTMEILKVMEDILRKMLVVIGSSEIPRLWSITDE